LRVTVPVDESFVPIVVGLSFKLEIRSPAIVTLALEDVSPSEATITHLVVVDVAFPVIVNTALVEPARTTTVAGMFTSCGVAERLTDHPPLGAGDLSVTFPFAIPPLPRVVGLTLKFVIVSPRMVKAVLAPVLASVT
jgi:hypothetical protein